jgi:hypothetical protein
MENNQVIDDFSNKKRTSKTRRSLLPWWIKTFCWIFMVFGGFSTASLFMGFGDFYFESAIYGFESYDPFSLIGLSIIAISLFKGITAFALWTERDFAITLGKIDAILGITLCIANMILLPYLYENLQFEFRLEIALLIPYLIKLIKIKSEWKALQPAVN